MPQISFRCFAPPHLSSQVVYDYFGSTRSSHDTLLTWDIFVAALLWLYTFLVTIVLVNLLIAQMSSTYEAVKDNAEQLALYQKVELFLEYKDNREVLPPPLNLVVILCYRLPKLTVQFFARFCCRVGTFEMMQVPPPHPSPEVLLRASLWVLMPLPLPNRRCRWQCSTLASRRCSTRSRPRWRTRSSQSARPRGSE